MGSVHFSNRKVMVIGHKNPDTDSICSAIAYAHLKSTLDRDEKYEARRAGELNRETEFVLQHFGFEVPRLCSDVKPLMRDVDIRLQKSVPHQTSLRAVWEQMRRENVDTLCVTDDQMNLDGLITLGDIANANMEMLDNNALGQTNVSYRNIVETLGAELMVGDLDDHFTNGRVYVGNSPEAMEEVLRPGDLVLLSGRYENQLCALECGAKCIVVCCGASVLRTIQARAKEKNCTILTTHYDTYAAARLIGMAAPVESLMRTEGLATFSLHTPVEEARRIMGEVRYRYFPVLDSEGRYFGIVSRRNMLNLRRIKMILVDHNEVSQAVDNVEEAEILEVIDHHRIGTLETSSPAYFRNVPVGCTSTIVYDMYRENGITPPPQIAGLMLSAILSDTLMFRSPTCTGADRLAAESLAQLAGKEINTYAEQMFSAADNLEGRTAEDLMQSDMKLYDFDQQRVGIGQSFFMTKKSFDCAVELLKPALEDARMKYGMTHLCYLVTYTPEECTTLLYCGKDMERYLKKAFDGKPENGMMLLPGVVSRKKQFVPPLHMAMQR